MTIEREHTKMARFRLSQETIAIITVGIALAGLNVATVGDLREEARADRAAWQAESQQLRAAWQTESRQLRDEARAEREEIRNEARADREDFQRRMETLQLQVVGLSIEQARLAAAVEEE